MTNGIVSWIIALAMLGVGAFVTYQEITLEVSRRDRLYQRIADFERKLDALDARVRVADELARERELMNQPKGTP